MNNRYIIMPKSNYHVRLSEFLVYYCPPADEPEEPVLASN